MVIIQIFYHRIFDMIAQTMEQKIDDILELVHFMVGFLQHEVATKDDLHQLRQEVKGDIASVRSELGDVKSELAVLHETVNIMDLCLEGLDKKVQEDGNAFAKDSMSFRKFMRGFQKKLQS